MARTEISHLPAHHAAKAWVLRVFDILIPPSRDLFDAIVNILEAKRSLSLSLADNKKRSIDRPRATATEVAFTKGLVVKSLRALQVRKLLRDACWAVILCL